MKTWFCSTYNNISVIKKNLTEKLGLVDTANEFAQNQQQQQQQHALFSPFCYITDILLFKYQKKRGNWLPEITIELKRAGSQFSKSDHTNLGRYTNTDKHTYT